jgi:hypothetical protein
VKGLGLGIAGLASLIPAPAGDGGGAPAPATWTVDPASYPDVQYVAVDGSDTTGDGSEGAPWATVEKGIAEAAAGGLVAIGAGTFTEVVTDLRLGREEAVTVEVLFDLDVAGIPGQTIIVPDSIAGVGDYSIFCAAASPSGAGTVRFFNLIFDGNGGPWHGMIGDQWAAIDGSSDNAPDYGAEWHNCVFRNSTGPRAVYGNGAHHVAKNCGFADLAGYSVQLNSAGRLTSTNCASEGSIPDAGHSTDGLASVTFDADYHITAGGTWENAGTGTNPDGTTAHIGVHGGTHAWGDWA